MNWYLEQKEAWNWKSMLPGGGSQAPAPIKPQSPKPVATPAAPAKPQRSRQQVEQDKKNVMMQMNALKGPQRGTPGAAEKLQALQKQYQDLLNESSLLHEMNWTPAPAAGAK